MSSYSHRFYADIHAPAAALCVTETAVIATACIHTKLQDDVLQFYVNTSGYSSMFRRSYVQKILFSEGSMFRRSFVQKLLCSEGSMFRRLYIQKVLCSESPMLRNICSEGPMFRKYG